MKRAKKIVIVSHGLLNVNSKVEGIATDKGCVKNVVTALIERNYGIYQMPCPEHICLGIKRWGQSVEQYNNPFYVEHCENLAHTIINEICDYVNNGYEVKYLIGMDGSPTCGVNKTFKGDLGGISLDRANHREFTVENGQGVFMKVLKEKALEKNINLEFLGISEADPSGSLEEIIKKIDE